MRGIAACAALAWGVGAHAVNVYPASAPAYSQSLDGKWAFRYIAGLDAGAAAEFYKPDADVSAWSSIAVPANWELKGFAEPTYGDNLKDGLGLYRRSFKVPPAWRGRRVFLRFEGIAFGYEAWVNGVRIGASDASAFNRHTFDVTEAVRAGRADHVLAVRVSTKPHGVEFDLNDDWSLSGIYRGVTLFSVPELHLQDLSTRTTLRPDGGADLQVTTDLSRADGEVSARLLAPNGATVTSLRLDGSGQQRSGVLRVAKPLLWSAESPSLYRLRITVARAGKTLQTVEERIGLREIGIDGGVLKLNGRPIKMRGVNHHDLDPLHGRAITLEQMRRDLLLMKQGNVNYLRTSHYPPDPRLLALCDELGFYVMDEVSIGHGEKNLDKPEYRANILARVEPTIVRDKNRASVLIWSIGNENPINDAELEAARLAKQLDPSRPVTIPKIGSYFHANHTRIPAYVDIHAPHYPVNARVADYAKTMDRPTIFTEYAHALGLATDRLQAQWDIIQDNPVFAGASVWHFMDQGILRTSGQPVDTGKPTQLVWINPYQYYDTHGLDGADGVTYADRTPQTDFWQMRKVYAPVQFAERELRVAPGAQQLAVTVHNRYDFRSLRGVTLHWRLERNGKPLQAGKLALDAAPRGVQAVRIPATLPDARADVLTLALRAVDADGLQINERTIRLVQQDASLGAVLTGELPAAATTLTDSAAQLKVASAAWTLTIDKASGAASVTTPDGAVLVAGIYPHIGRRPTMAEELNGKEGGLWHDTVLTALEQPAVTVSNEGGTMRLNVSGRYRRPGAPEQSLVGGYTLAIGANGVIGVRYDYRAEGAKGTWSEAGLSIDAPDALSEFRWIGQGPYAGYPGKDRLNEFGIFHLNRADLHFRGNRRATDIAALTTPAGVGIALAAPGAEVAVEREAGRSLLSHNALIGSLGNKGTRPEVTLPVSDTLRIAGAFELLPLGRVWPRALQRWFGAPGKAATPYRPFHHSYDQ